MKVRQAVAGDLDQLCRIRNTGQLFRTYLEDCDGERACFLVAEIDEQIAGFGLVYLDVTRTGKSKSHLPKLSDLFVAERFRRRGVGERLVLAREALAKAYGHSQIFVSIDPDESMAMVSLARRLGYKPLQDKPYSAVALHHDPAGNSFEKPYLRLDFIKQLT